MMNGYYQAGWMMGGGWMMIVGILLCLVIIGAVVWFVMRVRQNTGPFSFTHQPPSSQSMEQEQQTPRHPSPETYQEGGKRYNYPPSAPSPHP